MTNWVLGILTRHDEQLAQKRNQNDDAFGQQEHHYEDDSQGQYVDEDDQDERSTASFPAII